MSRTGHRPARRFLPTAAAAAALAGVAGHRVAHRTVLAARTSPDPDVLRGADVQALREHRVRTADGIGLHVEEYGDAAARVTIVLTHGWTLSGRLWSGVLGPLAKTARVLVYDHRGHGRSDRAPVDACSVAQLGTDLGTVIDALAPAGDLLLVGHSMGGMTIMHLAEQRPDLVRERVRGVVLVATSAGGLADLDLGLPRPAAAAVRRLGAPGVAALGRLERLVEAGRTPPEMWLALRALNFGPEAPARLVDDMAVVAGRTPLGVVAAFYAALLAHDGTPGLPVLAEVSTAIVVGDHDRLTPPAHARRLSGALPSAQLVVVPGAGHMVLTERPDIVADVVRNLLPVRAGAA